MKYRVLHSSQHRFHLDLCVRRLTQAEADTLYYTLMNRDEVENVQVFVRTAQMIVKYRGQSEKILLEYWKAVTEDTGAPGIRPGSFFQSNQ